jgi:hypothetical protein
MPNQAGKEFENIYLEQQAAKDQAQGITPNRFKARKALEGMNAATELLDKRSALLKLFDQQSIELSDLLARKGPWLIFKRRYKVNGARNLYDARERILWAIIGELALALTDVTCDQTAAAIHAEFAVDARRTQARQSEFRKFLMEHFEHQLRAHEHTGQDLYALAMELLLSTR